MSCDENDRLRLDRSTSSLRLKVSRPNDSIAQWLNDPMTQ